MGQMGHSPMGEWLDQEITQLGKLIIIVWTTTSAMWGMEGYYDDGQQWGAETTTRHNNPEQKMYELAWGMSQVGELTHTLNAFGYLSNTPMAAIMTGKGVAMMEDGLNISWGRVDFNI